MNPQDVLYDLEYHRAIEAEYKRQNPKPYIELSVDFEDWKAFRKLCDRYNFSVAGCFHYLIKSHG